MNHSICNTICAFAVLFGTVHCNAQATAATVMHVRSIVAITREQSSKGGSNGPVGSVVVRVTHTPGAVVNAKLRRYSAARLAQLGRAAYAAKDYNAAFRYWDAARIKKPRWVTAWLNAALARAALNDWPGAIERLNTVILLSPKYGAGYLGLGNAYQSWHGHDEQAATAYSLAAHYASNDHDRDCALGWLSNTAKSQARAGRFDSVLRTYQTEIKFNSDIKTAYFRAGFTYEKMAQSRDADVMFAKGRSLYSNAADAWTDLGDWWKYSDEFGFEFGNEKLEKAVAAYKMAVDIAAVTRIASPTVAYFHLADTYEQLERWPEVAAAYLSALNTLASYQKPTNSHNIADALTYQYYAMSGYYREKLGAAYLKCGDVESVIRQYAILTNKESNKQANEYSNDAQILLMEIANYGVPLGKIKVRGSLLVILNPTIFQVANTQKAEVFVDGKPLESKSFIQSTLEPMVWLYRVDNTVCFGVRTTDLSNGKHKMEVVLLNKEAAHISRTVLNIVVDNSHNDAEFVLENNAVALTAAPFTQ